MKKPKYICIEPNCLKKVWKRNTRCREHIEKYKIYPCRKGKNNANFSNGKCLKDYFCMDCGKKISLATGIYGQHRCASCAHKGEKSSGYVDGKTCRKYFCIDCGKEITVSGGFYGKGRCHSCSMKEKYRLGIMNNKGKNNNNFNNWSSLEIYPFGWTKTFKKEIRQRDNQQCQICGIKEKINHKCFDVHHIDYDKRNINPENLICLCKSCHGKTNYNRDIYQEYFRILKAVIK